MSGRPDLLAAVLAAAAVWLLFPSPAVVRRGPRTRLLVLTAAGVGGFGLASGWLPVRVAVVGATVALAAGGAWLVWRRHRSRSRRGATSAGVLEACEVMAAELTAGHSPDRALAEAVSVWPGLSPALDAWTMGSDVPAALRRLAGSPGAADLRLVAAAWQVTQHSGQGLAAAVARVAARIRTQQQTQRVVTSELASARATARLVAVLPVVALGMGSGTGGDPWRFLLEEPVGWGCLGLGLAFTVTGLWWIEAIADRVDAT